MSANDDRSLHATIYNAPVKGYLHVEAFNYNTSMCFGALPVHQAKNMTIKKITFKKVILCKPSFLLKTKF